MNLSKVCGAIVAQEIGWLPLKYNSAYDSTVGMTAIEIADRYDLNWGEYIENANDYLDGIRCRDAGVRNIQKALAKKFGEGQLAKLRHVDSEVYVTRGKYTVYVHPQDTCEEYVTVNMTRGGVVESVASGITRSYQIA